MPNLGAVPTCVKHLARLGQDRYVSPPYVRRARARIGRAGELGVILEEDVVRGDVARGDVAPAGTGYHARVGGFWAIFWLAVILKIPIVALLWIVWWAIRQTPVEENEDDRGGGSDRDPRPHRPDHPRPPRRGPHADPQPAAPARVRVARPRRRIPTGHR